MTTPMPDVQAGAVTIADLFRVLNAMQIDIARMATRLEVIDSHRTEDDQQRQDHESRLRALEAWRWKMVGVTLVVPALVGFLTAWLPSHVH